MKKCVAATLAILIGISSVAYGAPKTIEAFEQPDFLIKVNDEFKYHPEGLKPLVYGDRTYLPAAYIAELLGAKVYFNPSTKVVDITMQSNDEYETRIKELENEVLSLKKKLESKNEQQLTNANLKTFPVKVNKNGYELTLSNFVVTDDKDGRLYVELENDTTDVGVRINVHETEILINGKKYIPQQNFDNDISTEFYEWLKIDENLENIIPFRNVPSEEDIKTMKIKIVVSTNQLLPQPETYTFDINLD